MTVDKPSLDQFVGVFHTLARQHRDLATLLDRLKANPDDRFELWPQIRRELLAHERGEVEELYPILKARSETHALAEEHDRAAAELERLVAELDALPIAQANWIERFEDAALVIAEHANDEEVAIFPRAQALLGEATAHDLDVRFLRAKHAVEAGA